MPDSVPESHRRPARVTSSMWMGFAAFLAVALSIFGAAHVYVWWRLAGAPRWPSPWPEILGVVLGGLYLVVPVGLYSTRRGGPRLRRLTSGIAFVWMGV